MCCYTRNARPRLEHQQVNRGNAIAQAVAIGVLEKTDRRSYCAVSLPNILTYGEAMMIPHRKATHDLQLREAA
jgi:hypothetical protein